MKRNEIQIHADKIGSDIAFYICEKNLTFTKINNPIRKIKMEQNIFVAKEIGLSALCDLINFEKLLHGVLAARLAQRISSVR